jgi:hypothetical protein
MEGTLPDFGDKVVYVFFDGGAPYARTAVQNARFELQGGELFLVGRGLMSKGWGSDVPVGIAWSKVQWYSVFESPDAFYEAEAYYKKKHTKLGFWGRTRMAVS